MFWDAVAGVYDIFANIYNKKAHKNLCEKVGSLIKPDDYVLECACGTGMLSVYIAPRCKKMIATDFSINMLKKAKKKCISYPNVKFKKADILKLNYPDNSFDKVVAGNVIHLLDEPYKALKQLDRVCKTGGLIIIPTYMNKEKKGNTNNITKAINKAGANFKRQFTYNSYKQFFSNAGYKDVRYILIEGRVPCTIAIIRKI